jgi:uncharacterized phage-associated protein
MIGPLQREKIYEALAFFAGHVRYAGTIKLFKLLYYLDLMHFRRTGKTVTGLAYDAWPMGPVPSQLDAEFRNQNSDLHAHFDIKSYRKVEDYEIPTINHTDDQVRQVSSKSYHVPGEIKSKSPYTHWFLTKREMQIAEQLAEIFFSATAEMMTDVSHNKFGPWRKALQKGKIQNIPKPRIDLMEGVVAVGKSSEELPPEELKERVVERAMIERALA